MTELTQNSFVKLLHELMKSQVISVSLTTLLTLSCHLLYSEFVKAPIEKCIQIDKTNRAAVCLILKSNKF